MIFRESTQADLDFMADHSIKGGIKQFKFIDYVYTLEHDDIPLGIGGFRLIVPTTAWCWVDLSDKAIEQMRVNLLLGNAARKALEPLPAAVRIGDVNIER